MSKLPNAPLVEVVFELRWDINSKNDLIDFQYLHGDLYSMIKESFPIRENLIPPDIPFEALRSIPVFRFRKNHNSYPLIQIGPGVISFNTIDEFYIWENFRDEVNSLIDNINKIYPKFENLSKKTSLIYVDFIKLDNSINNSIDFINNNFNINISSNILPNYVEKKLDEVNYTFNYKIENNSLSLNIANGKLNDDNQGLILQTKVNSLVSNLNISDLKKWLNESHDLSSDTFKSIIKKELYDTFK
ncbi:TIGR04255 family protein [Flavobacterium tibetense]|uniref:TIGR04255 family protein n=1 Tax=Flavobacterium tibetense TaxID=2233533 RepID=A0A365P3R6_9FLAO|nr:TIGR04255 family protein [Flavobacterium tibetense]RBA29026.1 hypothetical protein DPN68_04490 [Flavobacterium tibetense]